VYYRMGLAYLTQGDWEGALAAFEAVEEASPGYRDGWKRAQALHEWKDALRHTRIQQETGAQQDQWQNRYELQGELGRGGMAVVYRARDRVLDRDVAMKFISDDIGGDDISALFKREAKAVASLNHPNIVTIYDFGTIEGKMFICMELIGGRSVEELLDEKSLAVVDSLRIIKQTLDGLHFAHQHDIVHRDIKPANIMRTNDGRVKLMDFGLAKEIRDNKKSSMISGTPAYMAPEQLRGHDLDQRADIFAVGVSLYELVTNTLPFDGMDRSKLPPPMRETVPAVPVQLDDAVMKALALDPNERWHSAEDMAHPIAGVLAAVDEYASVKRKESFRMAKPRGGQAHAATEILKPN